MRILILLFSLAASTVHAASPEPVYGKNGMVASRSQLASQVGVDIMRQGGNAVDAAVATAFALAVTYPSAGNLGGGSFAVIRLSRKKVVTLDQREMAPAAASRDMFLDERGQVIDGLSRASHLASGVPGSVDGLLTMLKRHGKKSREEVMAPAIRLAREGFPLSWSLARSFERQLGSMKPYAASMAKFSKEGKAYKPGDLWVQEDLARTLERIAEDGREGFYEGETA
ncbi:MAG: gamma-glutamyltransferase, partial [Pseudomonadales bacterium]